MKVAKFGGSSLASAEQVKKVCDIVISDAARKVVVVSAPGKRDKQDTKVTDMLIAAAQARLDGQTGEEEIARVIARYESIAAELGLPGDSTTAIAENLRACLALDTANAGVYLDTLKAAGEDNCARLVAEYLHALGVQASYVNPRDGGMLLSDEPGNARVLEESYAKLAALRDMPGIVIFPGFFGYSHAGNVVTFPRGGSDITGAILAAAVQADEYENFTDVDAVYAVDPRLVPEVRHGIVEMTYREMRELSYAGFGVFHDEAVLPAIRAGVAIHIRNTNRPDQPGTRVVPSRTTTHGAVVGIASDAGFCNIFVDKYLMNRELGFGRRLLQILEAEGVSYEHMPSGIDNVSVVIREAGFDAACEERVVARIRSDLRPDAVQVERGYALVMLVGEGLYYTVGMASKATRALADAGVNIEMMNQGSSEISMMFGVKAADRARAVQALYRAFFASA